jgi:hypothetical protein
VMALADTVVGALAEGPLGTCHRAAVPHRTAAGDTAAAQAAAEAGAGAEALGRLGGAGS